MQSEGSGSSGADGMLPPWRRVAPAHRWAELVLPEEERAKLRALLDEHGGGGRGRRARVLFVGERGTGKTMAAHVVAGELAAPIVELDVQAASAAGPAGLAAALWQLTREGEREGAVLVLDGAGPGRDEQTRRPAQHSAGGALGDLLGRCQAYPGLVIICTTVTARDLTEAPELSAVVNFPFPDAAARAQLWRAFLPSDSALSDEEIDIISRSFRLAGASIQAVCAAAQATAAAQGVVVSRPVVGQALAAAYRGALVSQSTQAALDALLAPGDAGPRAVEPGDVPQDPPGRRPWARRRD